MAIRHQLGSEIVFILGIFLGGSGIVEGVLAALLGVHCVEGGVGEVVGAGLVIAEDLESVE